MSGDGSEFSIDLGVKGGGDAISAAEALSALASKLEIAGSAATAASQAMAAGQASYNLAEAAANRAATAVEKIGIAAETQRGKLAAAMDAGDGAGMERAAAKLAQLTARQSEAVTKAAAASAAMNAEAASLDKLKAAAASAADVEANLSKQQTAMKKAVDDGAKAQKEAADAQAKSVGAAGMLEGAFAKLGGPLGAVGQKASGVAGAVLKMGKSLGAAGPYVAAVVLALAVATAFAAAALAITKFGVESADTARTQALLSDGIAGSVAGGRELDKTIADLGNKVPQTRDELVGMAADLAKTGLKGAALSDALEEAAVKAAKLKWGPDFAKQMLSLPNQAARLKQNFAGIFSGLKIEGLLEGLSKMVALFDSNTETGKALKVVFESLFQPVVDGLTAIIPKAIATFIQLEILAMKAMIALLPYKSTLEKVGYAFAILAAVAVVAIGVIIALLLTAVAIPVLLVAGFMWISDACTAAGLAIRSGVGSAVEWLRGKVDEVVNFFKGLSLGEIGTQLIQGLIAGLVGAGPGVITAITGIAGGAIDAAKKALGIASPSKVFAEIGMHTAAGMEQGVDGGAEAVQSSVEAMVAPPDVPSGGGSASTSATSSGGMFAGAIFNFNGVGGDAKSFAEEFLAEIERIAAQSGSAVPNG